jgi:hypothetical protein
MATLYELTTEVLSLLDSEEELDEQTLAEVTGNMLAKVGDYCKLFRVMESDAGAIGTEIDRLRHRKTVLENNLSRAKDRLKFCMELASLDEIKTPDKLFTVKLAQNPPKVIEDDREIIPAHFKTIVQEVKIDKKAIGDALKRGEEIPGAHLERGTSLRIR